MQKNRWRINIKIYQKRGGIKSNSTKESIQKDALAVMHFGEMGNTNSCFQSFLYLLMDWCLLNSMVIMYVRQDPAMKVYQMTVFKKSWQFVPMRLACLPTICRHRNTWIFDIALFNTMMTDAQIPLIPKTAKCFCFCNASFCIFSLVLLLLIPSLFW